MTKSLDIVEKVFSLFGDGEIRHLVAKVEKDFTCERFDSDFYYKVMPHVWRSFGYIENNPIPRELLRWSMKEPDIMVVCVDDSYVNGDYNWMFITAMRKLIIDDDFQILILDKTSSGLHEVISHRCHLIDARGLPDIMKRSYAPV